MSLPTCHTVQHSVASRMLAGVNLNCTLSNGLDFEMHECRSRNIPDLNKDRSLKKLVGFDAQKFSQAPAHVMLATLQHIRHRYGSPRTYLAEGCGFSVREQQALAKALRSGKSMM